jgi:hypothetical protein
VNRTYITGVVIQHRSMNGCTGQIQNTKPAIGRYLFADMVGRSLHNDKTMPVPKGSQLSDIPRPGKFHDGFGLSRVRVDAFVVA